MMRALLMTLALMPLRTPAQNSGKPAMAPYVMDDSSIRTAVPKWLDNPTVAEAEYGHISTWETSGVTNMSWLFDGVRLFDDISRRPRHLEIPALPVPSFAIPILPTPPAPLS